MTVEETKNEGTNFWDVVVWGSGSGEYSTTEHAHQVDFIKTHLFGVHYGTSALWYHIAKCRFNGCGA